MELARQLVSTGWEATIDVHADDLQVDGIANATAPRPLTIAALRDLVSLADDWTIALRREEAEIDYRRACSRGGGKYVAVWLLGQVA